MEQLEESKKKKYRSEEDSQKKVSDSLERNFKICQMLQRSQTNKHWEVSVGLGDGATGDFSKSREMHSLLTPKYPELCLMNCFKKMDAWLETHTQIPESSLDSPTAQLQVSHS